MISEDKTYKTLSARSKEPYEKKCEKSYEDFKATHTIEISYNDFKTIFSFGWMQGYVDGIEKTNSELCKEQN